MTKPELEELVTQVFASYNQTLYETDKKVVLRAWFDILHDVEYRDAKQAFLRIVATDKFMPKPADIRRTHMDTLNKVGEQPLPQVAWAILVGVVKKVNSGVANENPIPVGVQETINLLGDAAWNIDGWEAQKNFIRVYESVVAGIQRQLYEIPEKEAQAQAK